ncbi:MAG: isoprenyl transferase [Victivallales bacterium]|nr:isoprenyl transferase [Victivallales bacterium]
MPQLYSTQPKHIAIIMDGNGRWATQRGLPRTEGHKAGAEAVIRVLDCCRKYDVRYLTLYAFSTENWKRSVTEVTALMNLLFDFLEKKGQELIQNRIRLRVIGEIERLPWPARRKLQSFIQATEHFSDYNLTLALSYGGRSEIVGAAAKLAQQVKEGTLEPSAITEEVFASALQTAEMPDPDLIMRTAGEQRLSNFLLWQCSYAEFLFIDTLWPDFAESDFVGALEAFSQRQRRYGKA